MKQDNASNTPAKGSYAGHDCAHLTERRSGAHAFSWLTQNHSQVRKRTRTQIQDCGPELPPGVPAAVRRLFIDTPGGPDGCASTVFLHLSSHSALSVSLIEDAAVRLHLKGLNDVEPSSTPAPLTAPACKCPVCFHCSNMESPMPASPVLLWNRSKWVWSEGLGALVKIKRACSGTKHCNSRQARPPERWCRITASRG